MRVSTFASSLLYALLILALHMAGCSPPPNSIDIEDAWARPTAINSNNQPDHHQASGNRTAVYMTIRNNSGRPERLMGASTPSADTVEIHWSWIDEKGIMRMRPAETLEIQPEQELTFEPGGYHLMLIGVEPLQAGDSLQLALEFELVGSRETDVIVGHRD